MCVCGWVGGWVGVCGGCLETIMVQIPVSLNSLVSFWSCYLTSLRLSSFICLVGIDNNSIFLKRLNDESM